MIKESKIRKYHMPIDRSRLYDIHNGKIIFPSWESEKVKESSQNESRLKREFVAKAYFQAVTRNKDDGAYKLFEKECPNIRRDISVVDVLEYNYFDILAPPKIYKECIDIFQKRATRDELELIYFRQQNELSCKVTPREILINMLNECPTLKIRYIQDFTENKFVKNIMDIVNVFQKCQGYQTGIENLVHLSGQFRYLDTLQRRIEDLSEGSIYEEKIKTLFEDIKTRKQK